MSLNAHIEELRRKHKNLSEAIESAQRAPGRDDMQIVDLKKRKLRIKEEIERLSLQPVH